MQARMPTVLLTRAARLFRCGAGQVYFDDDYYYYSGETELTSATA